MSIALNLKKCKNIIKKHKKICISLLLLMILGPAYLIIDISQHTYIYALDGGLGNQMYMYAYSYAFEKETGNKMLYDTTYFDYTKNKHEFNAIPKYFNIDLPLATKKDIKMALKHKPIIITKQAHKNIFLGGERIPISKKTKKIEFNGKKYKVKVRIMNSGHYKNDKLTKYIKYNNALIRTMPASELFFKKYRADLLKKFTLREELDTINKKMLAKIKSHKNSVAIHIRRGDYVNHKSFGGVCEKEYFEEAMKKFIGLEDIHFFVFSNDINWVKENIKFPAPYTFVNINDEENGYKDMWLMKNCSHNIIANSTFSWWGAWLNENPNKIVIAPKCWSRGCGKNDRIPEDWIKIDNLVYFKFDDNK